MVLMVMSCPSSPSAIITSAVEFVDAHRPQHHLPVMPVAGADPQHMVNKVEVDLERRPLVWIGPVVSPRALTYSVTCQEWLSHGVCASRILPTTCVHRCSVAAVSFQAP